MILKTLAKKVVPIARLLASAFYSRRYLRGRYFDEYLDGWVWVARGLFFQKLLRINGHVPWPVSPFSRIGGPAYNLNFDIDDLVNFNHYGCYFQCFSGRIIIGKGTCIAPNVGFITANHNMSNLDEHLPGKDIVIGTRCWIGMNAVILPGVTLGPGTVVGAGSVVTKSYPDGYCILAGTPARLIKQLDQPSA